MRPALSPLVRESFLALLRRHGIEFDENEVFR